MARKRLTADEVLLRNITKAKTSEIRLRHSLAADREVIEALPDLEEAFWKAVKLGQQRQFAVRTLLNAEEALGLPGGEDEFPTQG